MQTGGVAGIRSLCGSDNFIRRMAAITTVRISVMKVSISAEPNRDCAIFCKSGWRATPSEGMVELRWYNCAARKRNKEHSLSSRNEVTEDGRCRAIAQWAFSQVWPAITALHANRRAQRVSFSEFKIRI